MFRQLKANEPVTFMGDDHEWLAEKATGKKGQHYAALLARLEAGETPRLSDLPAREAASAVQMVGRRRGLVSENPTPRGTFGRVSFATGTANMAKAIEIYRGGDPDQFFGGHKVRSFYNNLADPYDSRGVGDVTMDTHAASAAQLFRMPMVSARADKTVWTGASRGSNQQGAYAVYADAYREVAARHDMTPNQMQAVLWIGWQQVRHEYPGVVASEDAVTRASGVSVRDVYGPARASTVGRYGVQTGESGAHDPPRYVSQISEYQRYKAGLIDYADYADYLQRVPEGSSR
jgi:hypothetical protein